MDCIYRSPLTGRLCGRPAGDPIHGRYSITVFGAEFPPHEHEPAAKAVAS